LDTILKHADQVIYLKVSIGELAQRLSKEKSERPLIQDIPIAELPEFIGKHLFERNLFYSRANQTISGDSKTPEVLAQEIVDLLS
jgi:shikimate kinase